MRRAWCQFRWPSVLTDAAKEGVRKAVTKLATSGYLQAEGRDFILVPMNPPLQPTYPALRSGQLQVNRNRSEIRLAGQLVPTRVHHVRVLYYLMLFYEHTCTWSDLHREIYPGEGLPANVQELVKKWVSDLRKKLGDSPRDPRWIVTVRGEGYKFGGPRPEVIDD